MASNNELKPGGSPVSEVKGLERRLSSQPEVELLSGSDQGYFPGLVVSVLSAVKSLNPHRSCRVSIIDGGLDQASIDFLKTSFARVCANRPGAAEIVFLKVDLAIFDGLPKMGHSAMAYARILAPSLIEAEEVIWVDADMMIFTDLSGPVQGLGKSECLLAGVSDHIIETMANDCPVDSAPVDPMYLNTGLLWMNLREMREIDFSKDLLEKMAEWSSSLKFWDQTALNYATPHKKRLLDPSLNQFTSKCDARNLVALVGEANLHMISLDKPWKTPPAVSTAVRDVIFYKTFSLLTGGAFDKEMKKIESVGRNGFSWYALLKGHFYGMTGNEEKAFKWRGRTLRRKDFEELVEEVDRRLDLWHKRQAGIQAV